MSTLSLEARNLVKTFESRPTFLARKVVFTAVKDLSFEIRQGETVAFLGPNGAGKSTTIKMLCGILTPTSGSARILEHPAGSRDANKILGLVFGTRSQLFMHMTVAQCLDLIAEIYFLTGAKKRSRIAELAELFEIGRLLNQRVRSLSLGERMRCELVSSLLHRPKILLADEPTIGMDIVAKNRLRELIKRWQREERTTLMLTSHDLSDVEALCDRCILVDHGAKRYDGRLAELKGDLSDLRRVQIIVSDQQTRRFDSDARITSLKNGDDYTHAFEVRTRQMAMSETLSKLSAHYGDRLQDIQISEVGLEEVLHRIYSTQ